MLKFDMNLVTTEHGIKCEGKISFDLDKSDYGQKPYSIPLLTGPAKHFLWKKKDPLVRNVFERY